MYCNRCEDMTKHVIIKKDSLKDSGEIALLLKCDECKSFHWIVEDKEISKERGWHYHPFTKNIGDVL